MTQTQKKYSLTAKERQALISLNPQPGDILIIVRNHPHLSTDHPFPHLDAVSFICLDSHRFQYLGKDHLPYSPD